MKEVDVNEKKTASSPEENKPISIDIADLYSFEESDLILDISEEHYSNVAYLQVTPRDVYIDFLGMPGVKKDDKMVVKGTRIYMTHVAAQRLAESLGSVLKDVHLSGKMEMYTPRETNEVKTITKAERSGPNPHPAD